MFIIDWLMAEHSNPNWVWLAMSAFAATPMLIANWMMSDSIKRLEEASNFYQMVLDMNAEPDGAEAVRDALNNGSS